MESKMSQDENKASTGARKGNGASKKHRRIVADNNNDKQTTKQLEMMNEERENNNRNANNNNNSANDNNNNNGDDISDANIGNHCQTVIDKRPISCSSSSLSATNSDLLQQEMTNWSLAADEKCCSSVDEYESSLRSSSEFIRPAHDSVRSSPTSTEDSLLSSLNSSPSPDLSTTTSNHTVQQHTGKQLNVHTNLVPETRRANSIINSIRIKFLETLNNEDDHYEESDLCALRKDLPLPENQEQSLAFRFISRYVHLENFDQEQLDNDELDEIVDKLRELLRFRRQFNVPSIKADQFCKEFHLLHGIFPFGCDRQGLPVLYLRAHVHRRWSKKLDEAFRRYVAWQIDLITKSYHSANVQKTIGANKIEKDGSFGICFDCAHVSYSCIDMDFLRFLVRVLVHYYPTYCRYALCVDLAWLFRSVWKLVRSWLPEEAQNTVQLITSKQLIEYIDKEQIPNSIKISEDKQFVSEKRKHRLPDNFESIKSFEQFAQEMKLSSNEIKSFKLHMEKILKEYQQAGAI